MEEISYETQISSLYYFFRLFQVDPIYNIIFQWRLSLITRQCKGEVRSVLAPSRGLLPTSPCHLYMALCLQQGEVGQAVAGWDRVGQGGKQQCRARQPWVGGLQGRNNSGKSPGPYGSLHYN